MNLYNEYQKRKLIIVCFFSLCAVILIYLGIRRYFSKSIIESVASNTLNEEQFDLEKDFIYQLPNELGQFYPNTDVGSYSIHADGQESLVQKSLIAPFFKEIIDMNEFNQLSDQKKKKLIQFDQNKLPRACKFNLINKIIAPREIETDDDLKQNFETESAEFTFELRPNIFFENQKLIDNKVIKFTLEKYSDLWDFYEIFEFKENDYIDIDNDNQYRFTLKFQKPIKLYLVMKYINRIYLLEPEAFEKSLDENQRIQYGTKKHPFISYGPYIVHKGYSNDNVNENEDYYNEWIFKKNDSYFDKTWESQPYEKVKIIIEKNLGTGDNHDERQKFLDNKISFCAIDQNNFVNDTDAGTNTDTSEKSDLKESMKPFLFCKPDVGNLVISLSDTPRLDNINLRKALFYAIDRNFFTQYDFKQCPSLDLVNDNYINTDVSNIKSYNETEQHKKIVMDRLRDDIRIFNQDPANNNNLIDEQKVLNNYGFEPQLSRYFLNKYYQEAVSNDVIDIKLNILTSSIFITEENAKNFANQIEKNLFITDNKKVNILYVGNSVTQSDVSIMCFQADTKNAICGVFFSMGEKNRLQGRVASTELTRSLNTENKSVLELEKRVYDQLFYIPLCSQKQIRLLKQPEKNFAKYFSLFGFKNQPLDVAYKYW